MLLNYQVELCFVSFIIFIVMLLISKPWATLANPQKQNTKKGFNVFFIVFTIFNIFQFWARDYYAYYLGFSSLSRYINESNGDYELVYNRLADIVNNNYNIWRTIIWGGASVFTYYTAKKLDIQNKNLLVALTLITALNNIDNATRGVLGYTMLLFGVLLFIDKKSNTFIKMIGLAFFCVSYYFHKSMYVNIIFAVLALFPFGKKTVTISLIAFPFLTTVIAYLVNGIVSGNIEIELGKGVGGIGDRTVHYAGGEKIFANYKGMIVTAFSTIPEYLSLLYIIKKVLYEKCFQGLKMEKLYIYLMRLSFVCIYIASLFYFVETSEWIYIRFKSMGFFPLVFVLAKVWSCNKKTDMYTKVIISMFLIDILWFYIYHLLIFKTIYA